jgi:hypothetical protein
MQREMKAVLLVALALVAPLLAFPQASGSISGTVIDLSGNPVAGARIEVQSGATAPLTTTTAGNGRYTIAPLPAGTYTLKSTLSGFQAFSQPNITVGAGNISVNVRMVDGQLNTLGDGREFFAAEAASRRKVTGPTPRLANGKPDLTGLWYGEEIADAGKAVLKPWAAAIKAQRDGSEGKDYPQSFCLPMGITEMNRFDVWQIVQTPTVLTMISGVDNPGHRLIYTDGRPRPRDNGPTWYGRSIAHWDGDTLVIDTVGFNDKTWLASNNPHPEKLHVIERYRRPDLGRLEIELTLEDPDAFEQPWVIEKTAELAQDQELIEYICNENEKDRSHMVGR